MPLMTQTQVIHAEQIKHTIKVQLDCELEHRRQSQSLFAFLGLVSRCESSEVKRRSRAHVLQMDKLRFCWSVGRGAVASADEFKCVVQSSSPLSKLDGLVSVGRTCAEGGACERQTSTLSCACVCFSQTSVCRPLSAPFWTHKPLDPHWALLDSDWSGKSERARPLKRESSGYS
ncbi:hypothetical protein QQF64_029322 [Cirrhinus molitorella]|uniref:Uncharacterized protein n=1 Tax=Cirrhinus molitorella TaxID=172907 RepID=A0ABR3N9Q3_9TELE